jgi:hypothetical protein
MSAPQPKWTIYDDLVEAELKHWQGVTWTRQVRSKHYALVLTFEGVSRFVTYPCSPSDRRGALNHITTVKAVLREMGARRQAPVKSSRPKAHRPRSQASPAPLRIAPEPGKSRLSSDPWAALAGLKLEEPAEPPKPTFWARLKTMFRGASHERRS